jgi:hypothetical protein
MMKNTEEAFRWIVGILEKHQISFQISGGFAARMYGVSRELADIDIDVLEKDLSILYSHVKDFAIYGPTRYQDEHWDIFLMTLQYEGQEIDIGGVDTRRLFDKVSMQWIDTPVDFMKAVKKEVYGIFVPIISLTELLTYKKLIGREVDLEDVTALERVQSVN